MIFIKTKKIKKVNPHKHVSRNISISDS